MHLDGSKILLRICWALNLDINESVRYYQGSVDGKTHLNGSRICWEAIEQTEFSEIWLDGSKKLSRIYREETLKSQWIKNLLISIEKRERRLNRKRICRRSIEKLSSLKKMSFSKRKNIKRWMQHASDSNKDPINTHTHNKSNQFYISKTNVSYVVAKSHCTYTCIKSSKDYACCVWNIERVHKCLILWKFETRENQIHLHTINFEVHHISPTSPRNTLATIFKSILILFAFIFYAYFSFWTYHAWTYKREKKYLIM